LRHPGDPAAFNLGGRLFGGFWESLPRGERHSLRINGERVADLDYSGMFPRLAYLAAGAPMLPPDADPYAIPGLEGHRDGAKKALNALLSRTGPMRNLKGDLKAMLPAGMTAAKLTAAVNAHHPALEPLFGTDLGIDLMYTESRILVAALLRLIREHDIPTLPMHDGIMVPQSSKDTAAAIMREEARRITGVDLPVAEKRLA